MLSCNSTFLDISRLYKDADSYLQLVDQGLCSEACPCNISNNLTKTIYSNYYPDTYKTWVLSSSGAINFSNCPDDLKNRTLATDYLKNFKSSFQAFNNYMKYIENTYNCTGFCNTTYVYNKNTNSQLVKYLFSDINR